METLVCDYCEEKVSVARVKAENGCCPECGSMFEKYEDEYGEYKDYDDLEDENY